MTSSSSTCSSVFNYEIYGTRHLAVFRTLDVQGCCAACENFNNCTMFSYDLTSRNCTLYSNINNTFTFVENENFLSSFITDDYVFPTIYVGCICLVLTLVIWLGISSCIDITSFRILIIILSCYILNMLLLLLTMLGFILFFIRNTKGKRAKVHCTISAYCSDKQLYNTGIMFFLN